MRSCARDLHKEENMLKYNKRAKYIVIDVVYAFEMAWNERKRQITGNTRFCTSYKV